MGRLKIQQDLKITYYLFKYPCTDLEMAKSLKEYFLHSLLQNPFLKSYFKFNAFALSQGFTFIFIFYPQVHITVYFAAFKMITSFTNNLYNSQDPKMCTVDFIGFNSGMNYKKTAI